jgi:hypothetical protein
MESLSIEREQELCRDPRHDSLNYSSVTVRTAVRGIRDVCPHRFDFMTLSSPAHPDAGVVRRGFTRSMRSVSHVSCSRSRRSLHPPVGIGAITQQSALGQSLRVVVPVTLGEGEAVASECFRITAAQQDTDGVPQLLFGRVNVERSAAGANLVITNPRR